MNRMRLFNETLCFALVWSAGAFVLAQDVGERAETRIHSDSRFNLALSESDSGDDQTVSAVEQPLLTESSLTSNQDIETDGCFRPSCNCFRSFNNKPCPAYYFQVGALLLNRVPRFAQQPMVVNTTTNTTLLSTSDLRSNFNSGMQATFGMPIRGGRALEFSYFGLFAGNTTASAVKPDPGAFLIFPNNLVGNAFVDMDRADVTYSSWINSFAVNFPCCCGCCNDSCCGDTRCRSFTWFGGFRYLSLGEQLNISTQRTVGGGLEPGNYNIRTANNLYGMQLGARIRRTSGRFGWDGSSFAGIFGNAAQQTQSVTDFPNFPLRPPVSSRAGGAAFVGGANLSGLYALTNVWNLVAGYNVLWIEGVALAPDQLDFNFAAAQGGSQINNRGGVFLHGVNVGLEGRW